MKTIINYLLAGMIFVESAFGLSGCKNQGLVGPYSIEINNKPMLYSCGFTDITREYVCDLKFGGEVDGIDYLVTLVDSGEGNLDYGTLETKEPNSNLKYFMRGNLRKEVQRKFDSMLKAGRKEAINDKRKVDDETKRLELQASIDAKLNDFLNELK